MAEETKPAEPPKKLEFTEETPVVTHHTMQIAGKDVPYTVTTGRMPLKNALGEIEGQGFYMAYTLDSADPESRNISRSVQSQVRYPAL